MTRHFFKRTSPRHMPTTAAGIVLALALSCNIASAETPEKPSRKGLPPPFDSYVAQRAAAISAQPWLNDITPENWPEKKPEMRRQLQRMLGLDPFPARTPLNTVVTGTVRGEGYTVEKLHFQPLPGLYIGANLYIPDEVADPLPTILYMSGHASMKDGDALLGNKTAYQHHGSWFARHGYACLILDTIQLGEIAGVHHGTYRMDRWWWPARGYTPAGVEAWVGIRALDYLETRSEVDQARIGMTGRSGGGAYTWWVAALDERIKVAVPVAGITTLHDHVVEGAIEGHCDCMYMNNFMQWDFDKVAALIAPRPLLISNTDSDEIFPLEGVMNIFNQTRRLYRSLGKESNVGIHISEGPHEDTQPLNFGAFNWFNRFLKDMDRKHAIDEPAVPRHQPRELKVFGEIPQNEKVTTVDEFFVSEFSLPAEPPTVGNWPGQRDSWMKALGDDVFGAWPDQAKPVITVTQKQVLHGLHLIQYEVTTQQPFNLPLWILHKEGLDPSEVGRIIFKVVDDAQWSALEASLAEGGAFPERNALLNTTHAIAYFCPRGTGPTSINQLPKAKQTHLKRRLLLMGESLESGQVWDIRQAVIALQELPEWKNIPLTLHGSETMAANALYASLYLEKVDRLDLQSLPTSHRTGPTYPNVLRHLDLPQALAVAAERTPVVLTATEREPWRYALDATQAIGLAEQLKIDP